MSNINHISPGSINLSYRKLGNLLASPNRNDSAYDETEFYKLVLSIFNHIWSRETAQVLLASPSVTLEIDDIDSLQFGAEPNQNIFGEDLRLAMDPSAIKCLSEENVQLTSKRVMQNVEFSVDKLLPLFQVPHHKLNNPSKSSISGILYNVLDTVSNYLDLTCEPGRNLPIVDSPLFLAINPTSASITPDYCICDQRQNVVCVVNIKPPNLFSGIPKDSITKNQLCDGGMAEIMIELQICMIAARSRFGILCDGHHLILVEFDDDLIFYQQHYLRILPNGSIGIWLSGDVSFTIPLKILILDRQSSSPSFLEGLTYLFYQAKQAEQLTPDSPFYKSLHVAEQITPDSPIYKYLRLTVQPRDISNQEEVWGVSSFAEVPSSVTVPIFGSKDTCVYDVNHMFVDGRNGDGCVHRSQDSISFKIPVKYLKDVIGKYIDSEWEEMEEDLDDEDYVVMKIFEPIGVHDRKAKSSISKMQQKHSDKSYHDEWNIFCTLSGCLEFNRICLFHPELRVQYLLDDTKPLTGYAIILRYFEPNPIPLDAYELARHQVELAHEAGVANLDFRPRNMFFADGRIYLNGFSRSMLSQDCQSHDWEMQKKQDLSNLRNRFDIK